MAMSVNTDAATDKYAMKLFIVQYIDPNIQFLKKQKHGCKYLNTNWRISLYSYFLIYFSYDISILPVFHESEIEDRV